MKKRIYTNLFAILLVQVFSTQSLQAQQNLYGTAATDQHFTHVFPDGQDYYILGQDGFEATITRVLSTGAWGWTQKLNMPSGLLDAIVMPNGNLLFVGFTLQFPNQSIIGEIDRNKNLICLNIFDSPGTEGIARIDAINATTYLAVGFHTSNTPQDIVIYKISTATPGCAILQKYQFANLPGADYGHDIVVTGPNSFLVCGNDANNNAVIYHYNLIAGQLGGAVEPNQYEYVDMEPVSGDLLAAANSLNGGRPHIVRFDANLLPVWEAEIFGLTAVNQILIDANDKIYVVGTANNINRTVVLKLDDCSGTCPPSSDWPGGMARYLDNASTDHSGGFLAVANNGLVFVDGREGPGGIGMEDGFLSITDDDMTSMECMLEHQIDLVLLSTFFASPVGDSLFIYDSPSPVEQEVSMQMWDYIGTCESEPVDTCVCAPTEMGLTHNGIEYALSCLPHGVPTPVLSCPIGQVNISGFFGCHSSGTGELCQTETEVVWNLTGPNSSVPIDGGTTGNFSLYAFPPSYFQTNGTYLLTLSTLCPGQQDSCFCVLDWIVECDSCCTDEVVFLAAAQAVNPFGTLGNCVISFQADGLTDCMQITYDWGDGQFTLPITGNNVPVSHTYSGPNTYYVCYTIEEIDNNEICWEYTHCDSIFVICDTCCTDFDLFCQNVMNAVTASVDNSICKVTVNINNLLDCDVIQDIDWNDNSPIETGPFTDGDMIMHTYANSGTYNVSYTAIEYDLSTGLACFQKQFNETVTLTCQGCQCSDNPFSNIISHTTEGSIPFTCGAAIQAIPCPPVDEDLIFTFDFACDGPCTPAGVNWQLIHLPSTVVSSGVSTLTSQYTFTVPRHDLSVAGNYQLVLSGICNGDTCTCELAFTIEEPCEPEEPECCAYEINLINLYQDGRVKKVRVSAMCDTKICCADPDDWAQVLDSTRSVEWAPADGSPVPYGAVVNNDFIIFLDKNALAHDLMVEWFDQSDQVICRHLISISCNGQFTDDEDWLLYTSKTELDDPNLNVFAVREPDADDEVFDCDFDLRKACEIQYEIFCWGINSYQVNLYGNDYLYSEFEWQATHSGLPFTLNGSTESDPYFLAQQSGSYVVSLYANAPGLGQCNGNLEIIIPDIQPRITWQLLPCGTKVLITPGGWSDISDISTITWSVSPFVPGFPVLMNTPFTFQVPSVNTPYTVSMFITDKFSCSHVTQEIIVIDLSCKPSFTIDYSLCQVECPSGIMKPVVVTFTNTSTGGTCPGIQFQYDFGDGTFSLPFDENAGPISHTYTISCPVGNLFPAKLTMSSPLHPCIEETIQHIEIAPCDVFFTSIVPCPDGKHIFNANVPGVWNFPGAVEIAPWPHSDKPDVNGHQRFVAVRYPAGTFTVYFTGYCDNGGNCPISKRILVVVDTYSKNDKVKDKYFDPANSPPNWLIKSSFSQRQIGTLHRLTAKTIFKKRKFKQGFSYLKRSNAPEIRSSFTGSVYFSNCKVGCNYYDHANTFADSGILTNKKKAKTRDSKAGRFKSWMNSVKSEHSVKVNASDPFPYIIPLWLGKDDDNFKWHCPPD